MARFVFIALVLIACCAVFCLGEDDTEKEFPFKLDETQKANRDECLKANGMTLEDFRKNRGAHHMGKMDENKMCFFKCVKEKEGAIDASGKLVIDKVTANMKKFGLSEEQMSSVTECLGKIEKIENCTDMEKFHECFMQMKQ